MRGGSYAQSFRDYSDQSGAKNCNWKGGRCRGDDGIHLSIAPGKYVLEHRLMAEKSLGRPLKTTEHVHHINCDKYDNRSENLLICSNSYHATLHSKMRALKLRRE